MVIECNVELCKTDCEMCPEEQKYEPGKRRRKRDLAFNSSIMDLDQKISGRLRVVSPEDIADLTTRERSIFLKTGINLHHNGPFVKY